jgi:hypothetical protein
MLVKLTPGVNFTDIFGCQSRAHFAQLIFNALDDNCILQKKLLNKVERSKKQFHKYAVNFQQSCW